jgi:acyl carrier protein
MTPDEIKQSVLQALSDVAPEAEPAAIRTDLNLRDQLDIDSMDSLNFLIAVHEQLHVDIPEADWARLQTIDELVEYIRGRITVWPPVSCPVP